jgi:hypothetical protein
VCHSVSANGGVLGSGWNWGGGRGEPDLSKTFDLTSSAIPPPELGSTDNGLIFAWPGLTPDGKRALTNGVPQMGTQLKKIGAGAGIPAVLVDTTTVQVIPSSLPVKFMQTPAFSPDSLHVAFNNSDLGPGHLSVMDYDGTQNPPVFSNLTDVVQSVSLVGWPSYLPDSQAVVYHEGKNFETINAELRLVELGTKTVSSLAALNGYLPDGSLYLPWGAAQDQNVHYQPTVLPRPIGGYYWVMFSSRRGYGNTIAPGGTVVGGGTPGTITSPRLKIWVAAIDIDHPGKTDPSHPAFLLSGQELESGNVRPFVSLEPCRPQGASCESGADCCDGFCRETGRASDGTPILQCVPPPAPGTSCSNVDEFCTTPADCCDTTLLCILNRCAIPPPPPIF